MTNNDAKILNALRMGVIPDTKLSSIISGRAIEKSEIDSILDIIEKEHISLFKFIRGEYGTGKTFLLSYIRQLALENNYVVANLSINSGFNLSKLDVLYLNIMANLSIPTVNSHKGTDFEGIFDEWIKDLKDSKSDSEASKDIYNVIMNLSSYNNAFSTVLLTYIRAKISHDYELSQIAASWIKGDKNISYELKKKLGVKGSVDKENAVEMLKGFTKLLTLIGYNGLVITVDEVEIIMSSRSDIRMKSYSNIRYLMDLAGINELTNTCIILAGTKELFENEVKGFKSYEALMQRIGKTKKDDRRIVNNARQPILYLRAFEEEDYYAILEKVLNIHESFYEYRADIQKEVLYNLTKVECAKENKNQQLTPRVFIKMLISILDLMEKNPQLPIFKTKVSRKN